MSSLHLSGKPYKIFGMLKELKRKMNKPEIAFKLPVAIREPTGSFGVAFCPPTMARPSCP
jgi:hypothetical protein